MSNNVDKFLSQFLPNLPEQYVERFRSQYGPPPPPAAQAPSYEGATLQGMAPPPPVPFGPPPPPQPPSYEGASLQGLAPRAGIPTPPRQGMPLAQASNVDTSGAVTPPSAKAMAQATRVANASDKSLANVRAAEETSRDKKNLEGATFFDPEEGVPTTKSGGVPGAMTLVSKGGRTPQSWTTQTQEGLRFSPETEEASNRVPVAERHAAEVGRDAGIAEADREMAFYGRFEQLQERRAQDLQRRAEMQRQALDEQMNKLSDLTESVRTDKIDPRAYFTKNGAAGQFAASVAYMLGAVGGALTHTENPVDGFIRNEIDAQKYNAQLNRQKLDEQKGLLGQMTKTFGDERVAEEATWMAYLEKAKTQMSRIAADSKSDAVKAKYATALASIDQSWAEHKQKWDALTQDRVSRMQHDVNAPPTYAGGPAKLDKTTREEVSGISKAREQAGIPQALSELSDIDRTIDTFGTGDIPGVGPIKDRLPDVLFSDESVNNRQALQAVKNRIGHTLFGGALSPTEAEKLNKQLEGAHDSGSVRRVVQSFRQALAFKERNIRAMGSDEARSEFSRREKAAASEVLPVNKPSTPRVERPE